MTRLIDADALTDRIEADKKQDNISPGKYFLFKAYIMNAPTIEPTVGIINQIAEAIEAEIHEAWTESDADFNRGMEYAVSIVKAVDIRTDSDTISRRDAIAEFRDGRDVYDIMESIEELPSAPSAEAEQVTGKLKNPCDSLLTADSEACKKQKSKLDLISRQDAIEAVRKVWYDNDDPKDFKQRYYEMGNNDAVEDAIGYIDALPSAKQNLQPTCNQLATDLISRQVTIEELEHIMCDHPLRGYEDEQLLINAVKSLPSAPNTDQHVQHVGCVDLISRQDAVNEIHKYFVEEIDKTPTGIDEDGDEVYTDMATVRSLLACNKELSRRIKSLPSAPDSRQRGEWVGKYDGHINCYWYECDQCGEYRPRNQFGREYNANFCPNCGADMKGQNDGQKR